MRGIRVACAGPGSPIVRRGAGRSRSTARKASSESSLISSEWRTTALTRSTWARDRAPSLSLARIVQAAPCTSPTRCSHSRAAPRPPATAGRAGPNRRGGRIPTGAGVTTGEGRGRETGGRAAGGNGGRGRRGGAAATRALRPGSSVLTSPGGAGGRVGRGRGAVGRGAGGRGIRPVGRPAPP